MAGAQHVLADLARGCARQLVHQHDDLGGLLPGGSRRGEVGPGLVDVEREPRAGDHDRADAFAQRRVGGGDHRHVRHRRVRDQQVLDLPGGDVLAAADDDVLEPVGDRQVAAGVDPPDVPGPEPAAWQERGCVQRRVGVAGEQLGAAGEDLALPAFGDVAASRIYQAHLVARKQPAVGAGSQVKWVGDGPGGHGGVLAAAVGAERGDPGRLGAPDQARRDRGGPGQELAQRAEGGGPGRLLVEQAGQLDRRPAAGRDRVPVDEAGRQRGVPRLHDHRGRAEQQDPQQAEQSGHVTGREEPQVPGARAVEGVHPGGRLGQQGPMRMLHALRVGRGARGVHEHRAVVRVGAGLAVGASRLTQQSGVADRAVAGCVIAHDDSKLERGQPGQPVQHDACVRPAAVLAGEDDRGGARAPQHEVHFPGAVDHYHRQQHCSAQGDRRLDHRAFVGTGQLHRHYVAGTDAPPLQRPCRRLGVADQGAEGGPAVFVSGREHQRAAVAGGRTGQDVRGQRRLVHG